MRKILMRAFMSPVDVYQPMEIIQKNLYGDNMGNMLFPHSVYRTLLKEDMQIDTLRINREIPQYVVNRINEEYECLVLPFANAFRQSFAKKLENTASLIERLKIPCVVVGIGAQAPIAESNHTEELDAAVHRFMKAVLAKSAIIGVRGEFTANFLKELGYQEEKHFTVIGCPSMYLYGKELPEMQVKELTPNSKVSVNSKISLSQKYHDFMQRSIKAIPDYQYVPQVIQEIRAMYIGTPMPKAFKKDAPENFPLDFTSPLYKEGKGLAFADVPSWFKYLSEKDFSFGSRIHGNIAAILSGTPCFIMVSDERIKELVEYHNIPYMLNRNIKKDTSIFDLHEKADFSKIRQGHEKRFMHYLDFLKKNGLDTIYDADGNAASAPFDLLLQNRPVSEPIRAFSNLSSEEQLARLLEWRKYQAFENKYYKNMSIGVKRSVKTFVQTKITKSTDYIEKKFPWILPMQKPVKQAVQDTQEEAVTDEMADEVMEDMQE